MNLFVCFIIALTVVGCDSDNNQGSPSLPLPAIDRFEETLENLNAAIDKDSVVAQVISTGCTRDSHFSVSHLVIDEKICRLAVTRDAPDFCKRAAFVQSVKIEWPLPVDCRGLSVEIANPVLSAD